MTFWLDSASIRELTDVQLTDRAFQALRSLVERYGCIAGYPDSSYQGNRSLSRSEFAAGLNACLDRIAELLAVGTHTIFSIRSRYATATSIRFRRRTSDAAGTG